jgi:hypothetical protein
MLKINNPLSNIIPSVRQFSKTKTSQKRGV